MVSSTKKQFDHLKSGVNIACLASALCLVIPTLASAIDSFSTFERAEFYHNHSLQQWQVAYEALKDYSFVGNESVLEIGCRSGRIAANLAGRVPQGNVVGAEMRGAGAIEFASQNHSKNLYSNLSFVEQDFLDSAYENQFDLAVSFSSLHWFSDQKTILQKVYQELKPEGQILFSIPGKPLPEITALFTDFMTQSKWKSYFATYVHPRKKFTADEYQSLLLEVGFTPLDIKMQRCEYLFDNKRSLIDWFSAFSPVLDCIPEESREEFLADFANQYVHYFPIRADGQILFVQDELFIHAVK